MQLTEEQQKLVRVIWTDVVEITSPEEEIKDYSKHLADIESVGYIVQDTPEILALVKERFEGKPEQILVIPKPLVKEVKEVGKLMDSLVVSFLTEKDEQMKLKLLKDIKKVIVSSRLLEQSEELANMKFTIQKHWYGKAKHWDISIGSGKGAFNKWAVTANPIQAKIGIPILVVKKAIVREPRWFNFSGVIRPEGEPDWLAAGNPTKNFTAYIKVIDRGVVDKAKVDGKTVYHFKGSKMKGFYAFRTMGGPMEDKLFFLKLKEPKEKV